MATVSESTVIPLSDLLNKISLYRYNPTNIQRVILDHLNDVTNGKIDIVDPTSPFVFLLEASSVNAAAAMQENRLNLRRQYKQLAQSVDEIYPHMSDKNFINLFAIPSKAKFTFMIQMTSFENSLVNIPNEEAKKSLYHEILKSNLITIYLVYNILLILENLIMMKFKLVMMLL